MKLIESVAQMQAITRSLKAECKKIALVPTMGYLHEGHLSLMKQGRGMADILVTSIFVNPTQFGASEDLDEYPRDLTGDLKKCEEIPVDYLFAPKAKDMYPNAYQTYVTVEEISKPLCGNDRPVHFRGVATVVSKLFNICMPDYALFGMKDFQQLAVIQRMTDDLNFDVEIVWCDTVRESDGLAMSSRNAYLSDKERSQSPAISKSLKLAGEMTSSGEREARKILDKVRAALKDAGLENIDYAQIRDPETLEELDIIENEALLAIAVKFGKARLIDNATLRRGKEPRI